MIARQPCGLVIVIVIVIMIIVIMIIVIVIARQPCGLVSGRSGVASGPQRSCAVAARPTRAGRWLGSGRARMRRVGWVEVSW